MRRTQLIEATISVIAAHGYAATTLAAVARQAGVSHGMVNFHFTSKQILLTETLDYLAGEYRQNWTRALDAAGPGAADRLRALIVADFEPALCTADRLSAWCAFWGEAQSKPMYQAKCGANDAAYGALIVDLCRAVIEDGGYDLRAEVVARALRCLSEGLWLEMMTAPTTAALDAGKAAALATVGAFFPRHFGGSIPA